MARRILIVDEGEYEQKDIRVVQSFINSEYDGIELLLDPDRILAICDIKYSFEQVRFIVGEAYMSLGGQNSDN